MPIQPLPQDLPRLWLLSDARNDRTLEDALEGLPGGSGFVFRHYHLDPGERRERWEMLRSNCRSKNHLLVLSAPAETARAWSADGVYGPPERIADASAILRIATVHNAGEITAAEAAGADALMLSPVFATRSHPGAPVLGPEGFHALARQTHLPVIALGGMTAERARDLGVARWAAIDGLSRRHFP